MSNVLTTASLATAWYIMIQRTMTIITVLGSLSYDFATHTDHLPELRDVLHVKAYGLARGGKGGNQAIAIRRLSPSNVRVRMNGRLGNDIFGGPIMALLLDEGINVEGVTTRDGLRTAISKIICDPFSREHRLSNSADANNSWTEEDVRSINFIKTRMLVCQDEIPLPVVHTALQRAHDRGILTLYNLSPTNHHIDVEVFQHVDFLVILANGAHLLLQDLQKEQYVPETESGINAAKMQVLKLSKVIPSKYIVLYMVGQGSVYHSRAGEEHTGFVPAVKAEIVIDETIAEDTFVGGFASRIVQGDTLEQALRFATAASAIAVSRLGAARHIPTLQDLSA